MIKRALQLSTDAATLLAGIAVAIMMVQVSIDAVMRYVFNAPLPGTISFVSHYYMLIVVFLPLAAPEWKSGHISVDIVTNQFPDWLNRHIARWTHLYGAAIYAAITYASWGEAVAKFNTSARVIDSNLSILIWPGYFMLPIGCGLMTLVLLFRFFESWSSPRPATADAEAVS
jgi:TRAP-type C4-dicarboxylate transport system permease small subunit